MDDSPQLPSDGQLVAAARLGMGAAWDELAARHEPAVRATAKALRLRPARRFAQRTLEQLRGEIVADVETAVGEPAVRAIRPRALALLTDGRYAPASAEVPAGPDTLSTDELVSLADAFSTLPEPWQTVLWHGLVERRSAAEMTPMLGRGVNDVATVQDTAEAGLYEAYLRAVLSRSDADLPDECRVVIPLLGGHLRRSLSAHQQQRVDAHLGVRESGCDACRRRLAVSVLLPDCVPEAITPGITGLDPDAYRAAIGTGSRPIGTAGLAAKRSERVRRLAAVGATAAVVAALVGAALIIRRPFELSDSSPTSGPAAETTVPVSTPATEPPAPVTTVDEPAATTTQPAPTTTELELRPPPTGPENRIELVFADASGAQSLRAPAPPDVDVVLAAPAPAFTSGSATIDVSITNRGDEDLELSYAVLVSHGILLDRQVSGAGECVDPPDDSAMCTVDVPSGGTEDVVLRMNLDGRVVGRLLVETSLGGDPLEVDIESIPRLVHSEVVQGDIVVAGNSLITCDESASDCAGARAAEGPVQNRWDVPLNFIQQAPELGWTNSSSAAVDLGDGSVVAAYLFWSGDLNERGQRVPDDGRSGVASFRLPDGTVAEVEADRIRLGDVDATQYFGFTDVTDLVAAAGSGNYTVGNVASVEIQGSYAGWALYVVRADDAEPRRHLVITSPFAWASPDHVYRAMLPTPDGAPGPLELDVLAFEGEPLFEPEAFVVGGMPLGGTNPFDGTIIGDREPSFPNNFGVDLDTYALTIDSPDGALPIEATSDKDGIRLAVLGFAVDLAS